jgi:hypothetical protein
MNATALTVWLRPSLLPLFTKARRRCVLGILGSLAQKKPSGETPVQFVHKLIR